MKNISALFLALALSATAFAQDAPPAPVMGTNECPPLSFKSKNGHEVLPQQGEWALGVSATSFLNYIGNMMNASTFNPAPTFNQAGAPNAFAIGNLSGAAVTGKYMKKPDMAYRVRFQLNGGTTDYRNLVLQSSLTPDPLNPKYVEDKQSNKTYAVLLGAGFEKRRGTSRVQGIYGAELLLGLAGGTTTYTYGNKFTTDFNAPVSTTDFQTGASAPAAAGRTKETKTGTMFLGGVRGFVGVEYFIAPKWSVGGEVGYTLGFSTNGEGSTTTEYWNSVNSSAATLTEKGFTNNGVRSWGIGLDNVNASINFNFYF